MTDFLAMGGYARFVWSAFAVSLVVLVATVWLTKRGLRTTQRRLARRVRGLGEAAS